MSSRRGPLRNRIEALLVAIVFDPIGRMPRRLGLALLKGLGSFAFHVMAGRRAHARRRVQCTLGCTRAEADRIVRGAFQTMAQNVLEADWVARELRRRPLEELVTIEGREHIDDALAAGHGVLAAGAHLGAWEAQAVVLGHVFKPVWAVARPLDNPLLEQRAVVRRGQLLAGTLEKDGSARKLMQLVRDGEIVGLLLDQNAGSKGVMLPFLGLPTRMHRAAGTMGARMGAKVVPTYMLRESAGRYRLVVEAPVSVPEGLSREQTEREVVLAVSHSLERQVLAHPEQWLWLHDRWHSAEVVLFHEREARAAGGREAGVPVPAGTPGGTNGASQGTNGA